MERVDYFRIIHKYIAPDSPLYPIYIIHCQLVANKALKIARKLKLSEASQRFIEEAAMLHDIGIFRTDAPGIFCYGELPYVCHVLEGRKILEAEGLPDHAQVAESHIGVGVTQADILEQNLPFPPRDIFPVTLEEQIISFADFFFSKNPEKLWQEKSLDKIRKSVAKRGKEKSAILERWIHKFYVE
ncbi:MAG: HDIG domain-containing protein [Caldilineaceae bacterium]|nr:HDIG domain-containing protein [Caldilineaceae bacterium]MCB0125528.1 HDIG domain-containing protein [Caldilineaceae bacterium]